jgi:integrase/recombinase XerD
MTRLEEMFADYLTIRRAVGFKLVEHQRLLPQFVAFVEQAGASTVTTQLALDWAIRTSGNDSWKTARLSIVRGFARYLRTIDPTTEIPPDGVLCAQPHKAIPYLYSEQEIARLLDAAAAMRPPMRAATFTTIIGLLAVSGMRIGETLALDRDDVNLDAGALTIRDTKFGKSRLLPLHPASTAALAKYARVREELCPAATGPSFFISSRGSRPDKSTIQTGFRQLRTAAGITGPPGGGAPRLHDFRHYADGGVMRPAGLFSLVRALPVVILSA